MNEINLIIKEVIVKSEVRPLRASWTTEMPSELIKEFSDEIRREIRKKKIERILKHMA